MIARTLPWRLALWTLAASPVWLAMALGYLYVGLAQLLAPALERRARRSLALAGIDARDVLRTGRRSVARFLVVLARFRRLSPANYLRWARIEGWEHFRAAAQGGCGVLLVSGHVGHWELGAFAGSLAGLPMHLLIHRSEHHGMETCLEQLRTAAGNRLIENQGGARAVASALRKNEVVCTLIDTAPAWLASDAVIPFLGGKVPTTTAMARLAYATGAAVVPVFVLWAESEQRYIVRFHERMAMSGSSAEDMRQMYAILEQVVREHPDQYFWIFDPAGANAK